MRGTTNRNARGSAADRRARKQWLLDTFGDGVKAPCAYCGVMLDIGTITVDRWPVPGCRGGTYRRGNIRPACAPCNSVHGGRVHASAYEWRYVYRGRVVHALRNSLDHDALCGVGPVLGAVAWRGTGSQDEYERAAALPQCRRCARLTKGR